MVKILFDLENIFPHKNNDYTKYSDNSKIHTDFSVITLQKNTI